MNNYDLKQEQTLVIVKPDGVQRGLIGEVIKRYEQCGLKLVALKMLIPTADQALAHYSTDPTWAITTGSKAIAFAKERGEKLFTDDPIEYAENIRNNCKKFFCAYFCFY